MRVFALLALFTAATALAQTTGPATQPAQPIPDQAELERKFAEKMTGAALVGRATYGQDDANPREDRYILQRVSKVTDAPGGDPDRWLIVWQAKIRGREVPIPLIIPVKWAGDTPVISVTDMSIPSGGTYTARVMIYGDRYAGTWSGKTRGGHLWGRIERASTTQPATQAATP